MLVARPLIVHFFFYFFLVIRNLIVQVLQSLAAEILPGLVPEKGFKLFEVNDGIIFTVTVKKHPFALGCR